MRTTATRADLLLIACATALIGWLYVTLWPEKSTPLNVEIRSGNRSVQTLSLTENRQLTVVGDRGPSKIEVRDTQVRFLESPCTNKICIRSGWLQHSGETTACLPNRVSLRILGRDPRYDAINF